MHRKCSRLTNAPGTRIKVIRAILEKEIGCQEDKMVNVHRMDKPTIKKMNSDPHIRTAATPTMIIETMEIGTGIIDLGTMETGIILAAISAIVGDVMITHQDFRISNRGMIIARIQTAMGPDKYCNRSGRN